jgi:hypothetical protein
MVELGLGSVQRSLVDIPDSEADSDVTKLNKGRERSSRDLRRLLVGVSPDST